MTEWKVGDTYWIYDGGRRLFGEITAISEEGYTVKWADGTTTIEDKPDAASDWHSIHGNSGE